MAPSPVLVAPSSRVSSDEAYAHIRDGALTACDTARIGLEIEFHLIDLDAPSERPDWARVSEVLLPRPVLPGGSALTVEPGGQLELSGPPAADVCTAVDLLRADEIALRRHCARHGLGLLAWGSDPLRAPRRIHPGERYEAMEAHFSAADQADPGVGMMTGTASLQVNIDVGDGDRGAARWRVLEALGPVLTAISANSPQLAGRRSGWASMRQQTWEGMDARRVGSVTSTRTQPGGARRSADDPGDAWAAYALAAPVMLVADLEGGASPVLDGTTMAEWLAEPERVGRAATAADLGYHLTTLFPPMRPRGFVEVRCLDVADSTWWPALAAVAAVVTDDESVARLEALFADRPQRLELADAARVALASTELRQTAVALVELAGAQATTGSEIGASLERLAAEVAAGRSPGDQTQQRLDALGAERAVREASEADERGAAHA